MASSATELERNKPASGGCTLVERDVMVTDVGSTTIVGVGTLVVVGGSVYATVST